MEMIHSEQLDVQVCHEQYIQRGSRPIECEKIIPKDDINVVLYGGENDTLLGYHISFSRNTTPFYWKKCNRHFVFK